MARKYPYDISPDALYHPAKGKKPEDFFVDWTAAELANTNMVCAELCRLAYGEEELVRFTLPRAGMKLVDWIGGENIADRYHTWGTDGFVALGGDGRLIVVFRGSEPGKAEDIIADLRIKAVPWWQGGLVHEGFNAAYHAVHDQLQTTLGRYSGELTLSGHSLGGAIATLAAADHLDRKPNLVTFGCPRVGNDAFVALLADKAKPSRYVDCCDVVARVPPEKIDQTHLDDLLGCFLWSPPGSGWAIKAIGAIANDLAGQPIYKHFGNTIYIDSNGKVLQAPSDGAIATDQAAARSAYPPKVPLASTEPEDHDILGGLFDAIKEHLGVERVPFRDLADHTPLNYLSAFTGRS